MAQAQQRQKTHQPSACGLFLFSPVQSNTDNAWSCKAEGRANNHRLERKTSLHAPCSAKESMDKSYGGTMTPDPGLLLDYLASVEE